ncbi:uncharacterized protein N7498_005768 [Penicillium cinerascens]|uniref:Uncharacterized protein n=1 Tax=Penicillium cinerascens TaxID=70096 RepID=A0A9W9T0H6_9EURO|nr:uncharacterized protein N7498_005768 [Penicillium cinerascens]KAJ5204889.1 hypothetical protein N7498_005768 [Penicillium cinerascens]
MPKDEAIADPAAFARNDGQFEIENGPRENASTKLPHNSRDFANEMSPLGACVAGANIVGNVPPKPKAGVFQWKTELRGNSMETDGLVDPRYG